MPTTESTQHKLSRIRPPRVQITYDVEIGDAIEMKELPFVVGILADLSGNPEEELPKLKHRKFINIDRDDFNDVMASIGPRVTFQVANTLTADGDDSKLNIELKFRNIDDFQPENVVKQVEPLRQLMEARRRLRDLLSKLDGNDNLDSLLQDVAGKTEDLQKLKDLTSSKEGEAGAESAAPEEAAKPEKPEGDKEGGK